jgi:cell division protease FtsH
LNDMMRNVLIWLAIALVLMFLFGGFPGRKTPMELTYSDFLGQVKTGMVTAVELDANLAITGKLKNGKEFIAYNPETDNGWLIDELYNSGVQVKAKAPETPSLLLQLLLQFLPIIVLIGFLIFITRQMHGGSKGAMSFGKSRARLLGEDQVKVTLDDVAGSDEAKEEVGELVDFLRDPGRFQRLGGKIPRGVLMVGRPGTGKTLLARAIAGEARVPFFTISGSDFVEMFVGVGASRVRDMFEQAKAKAPCIIFIDEIDAVGRHRGAGLGGGHDEREQTLNQLLVEMDGFEGNEGVIVIAATNRPDVLDPALLRPGRFDRQVVVPLPDVRGREQILKVHMKKVPLGEDVDARVLARGTPGFSGADLANLVNEAALFAARKNNKKVMMISFEQAKDKIMMGAERRSMVMTEKEKKLTAYHEAGHAVLGWLMPSHDPVHKVTIIPRGQALGVTFYLPENDKLSWTKEYAEAKIVSAYGGRLAELIIFGKEKVTSGAASDIQHATQIARMMVTKWGMSDRLGPLLYDQNQEEVFLGHSVSQSKIISDETTRIVDEEVLRIITENYDLAEKLLNEHIDKLHAIAEALIKYETLDKKQIDEIMEGKPVTPPTGWEEGAPLSNRDQDNGSSSSSASSDRLPSGKEPVTEGLNRSASSEEER